MYPVNSSISTSYMAPSSNVDGSGRVSGGVLGSSTTSDMQLASGVQSAEDQVVAESSVSSLEQDTTAAVQLVTSSGQTESVNNPLGSLIDTSA